jgi:hypothetical protein
MRLNMGHLRSAAIGVGIFLIAFAALQGADYLIGRRNPFLPGAVAFVLIALWVLLLSRYGRRPPPAFDPRRQLVRFFSAMAICGALAVGGLIAALAMRASYSEPSTSCPSAAAQCHQPLDGNPG